MPMKYKHPSNKGKIPSDEMRSRGYDDECGVDEERSTGVERENGIYRVTDWPGYCCCCNGWLRWKVEGS